MKALLPKEFADRLEPHLTSDRYPDLEKAWVDSTGNLDGDPTDAEVYFKFLSLSLFLPIFSTMPKKSIL